MRARVLSATKADVRSVGGRSTNRLHTIAGEPKAKDDPAAIVRTQGILPTPAEVLSTYLKGYYVTGDIGGSHYMPLSRFLSTLASPGHTV